MSTATFTDIFTLLSHLSSIQNENRLLDEELIDLADYFVTNKDKQAEIFPVLKSFPNDNLKLKYLRSKIILKPDLLTEEELFRVVIPVPELLQIKTTNTTQAATRKVPNIPVLKWKNFLSNAHNSSTTLDTNNRRFSKPNVDDLNSILSAEDSAVDMFLKTMDAINNKRLILLQKPEHWCKPYMFKEIKGRPDAIRCSADDKNLLKNPEASQILSIVEVKPEQLMKNLIGHGTELFEEYNTALTMNDNETKYKKIIRIVRQHENPDTIYISPAIYINQGHTDHYASFSECVRYYKDISTTDPFTHSSPPNTEDNSDFLSLGGNDSKDNNNHGKKDDDQPSVSKKRGIFKTMGVITRSMSAKGKEKNISDDELLKNMKNYKRYQISFGDLLGGGRSGSIFKVMFYEEIGVLKMVDLYKNEHLVTELLNEIKIYLGPLMDIQEIFVPNLLKYGILHEAFAFIFISFAGKSFAELENDVTLEEKKLAISGLQMIHERGVRHGDIRLENIMINRNELTGNTSVWWIDFCMEQNGMRRKRVEHGVDQIETFT
ncbi:16801_t:CDS:2, partial [Racocetra persica]